MKDAQGLGEYGGRLSTQPRRQAKYVVEAPTLPEGPSRPHDNG